MWETVKASLDYIRLLIPMALKAAMQNQVAFWSMNIFMFVQNILFFMVWVIYFSNFSNLRGWTLADVATMNGIAAFGYGVAFLFCGGATDLGRTVMDGELDVHLGRPRHPLIGILFKESRLAGLGDILTAPVLWFWFANYSYVEAGVLFVLGLFSALIILATTIVLHSLPFFLAQSGRSSDQLFESFMVVSIYPQNGFSLWMKVILVTVVPAGFVAFVPVQAMKDFDVIKMLWVVGAAFLYMCLAVVIFNRGLRRYTSGNKMLDVK